MKSWSKFTKILAITSSVFALIIFGFAIYFYTKIKWASQLMTFDNADPDFVDSILSYSVTTPNFLVPLIFCAIFFFAQYIIAAWFIVKGKTKQEKIFGYLTLIIGGLIIFPLYLTFLYFKGKNTEVKTKNANKWMVISASVVTPVVVIVPLIGVSMYKGIDVPTKVENVKFSTLAGKENIIEIFTDGFDPQYAEPLLKNESALKDFTILNKYVVAGAETSFSFPTIMSGLNNNIYSRYDNAVSKASGMTEIYSGFAGAINTHLTSQPASQTYFLDTNSISNGGSYMSSVSGQPKMLTDLNHNLQVVNWAQAKEDVAGSFGVAPYGTDQMFYEWVHKKSVIQNDPKATSGTRFMLQEFITHSPRITGKHGELTFATGHEGGSDITIERGTEALVYDLKRFINDLQQLKDSNGNVYDNSLILIYGDHANHSKALPHPDSSNLVEGDKFHSLAMVKYPHQPLANRNKPLISEKPFYAPFMNELINHWKINGDKSFDDFTNDSKIKSNFEKDREFLGFFNREASILKFDGDVLKVQRSQSTWSNLPLETSGWVKYSDYQKFDTDRDQRQNDLLDPIKWRVAP